MYCSQESKENTYAKCILSQQGVHWTIWSMKGVLITGPRTYILRTDKVDAVVGRMGKGQYIQLYSCDVQELNHKQCAEVPVCLNNVFIPHHETEETIWVLFSEQGKKETITCTALEVASYPGLLTQVFITCRD